MLARMEPLAPEAVTRLAALAGLSLTAGEAAALAPLVSRTLAALAALERPEIAQAEPAVRYDVLG